MVDLVQGSIKYLKRENTCLCLAMALAFDNQKKTNRKERERIGRGKSLNIYGFVNLLFLVKQTRRETGFWSTPTTTIMTYHKSVFRSLGPLAVLNHLHF